jgi:hypothetical protein
MTATLPSDLRDVFARCTVAELVTIDELGRPITQSVAPTYRPGGASIDVNQGCELTDPHVALLFAEDGPIVLVQGTAHTDGVLHVRPERVYAWRSDDPEAEPQLFDAHLEEVRSGHNEEPEVDHPGPVGSHARWDCRLDGLDCGLLACIGPDGFPFAVRLGIAPDPHHGVLRLPHLPVGMPADEGPACLHATVAGPGVGGARGPRVHGDLVDGPDGWRLIPHAVLDA